MFVAGFDSVSQAYADRMSEVKRLRSHAQGNESSYRDNRLAALQQEHTFALAQLDEIDVLKAAPLAPVRPGLGMRLAIGGDRCH